MSDDPEDRFRSIQKRINPPENKSSEIHAQEIEGKIIHNLRLLKSLIRGERVRLDQFIEKDLASDTDKESSIQKLKNKIIDLFFGLDTPLLAAIDIPKKFREECFDLIVQGWRKKITSEYSQTLTLLDVKFSKESFRAFVVALSFSVTLRALRLEHCSLREKEAEMLAIFLKVHPAITVFHLDNNPIEDAGFERFSSALLENDTLIHLSLNQSHLTDKSLPAILSLLEERRYQSISLKENEFSEKGQEEMKSVAQSSGTELFLD